jgi:hypothetical protein
LLGAVEFAVLERHRQSTVFHMRMLTDRSAWISVSTDGNENGASGEWEFRRSSWLKRFHPLKESNALTRNNPLALPAVRSRHMSDSIIRQQWTNGNA